ncbi:phosphate acyltransferase PlsX [candidate division KSB1 bacterium]|nr:MAG: phosphate acyltransferase PlsX [candidate division KSB1 bacterium]
MKVRIAVDAMGGDNAPKCTVAGAIDAARKSHGRFEVVLVGDRKVIEEEMKHHLLIKDLPITIEHASQKVEMHESPSKVFRSKPDSSIAVAMNLHKEGSVDAVVSAGNTGAVMASALFMLGTAEGVLRPAIGSFMPHEDGVCLMADVGSVVNCKPQHLYQFGVMGSIFMNYVLDMKSPKVSLLNIGEEESKGTEVIQEAYQLLEDSDLNFIGNIEGRDILTGKADVVVCDGFTGNVILKFGESLARMVSKTMKKTIRGNLPGTVGMYLIRPSLRKLFKLFDYQEYGGAPLLGIKGTCIIGHGSSKQRAIKNAVEEAWKMVTEKVSEHIEKQLAKRKGE